MTLSLALVVLAQVQLPTGPPPPYFNELRDFAGQAGISGPTDGIALSALFDSPRVMTTVPSGDAWVVTGSVPANQTSIRLLRNGQVSTVTSVPFIQVGGIVADPATNVLYLTLPRHQRVVRVEPSGKWFDVAGASISTGTGPTCFLPPCFQGLHADGLAGQARFNGPRGIAIDSNRRVYIADSFNGAIRVADLGGMVTTLLAPGSGLEPSALAVDAPRGRLIFTSRGGLFSIPLAGGQVTWLAGGIDTNSLFLPDRMVDGDVTVARFGRPNGIAVDAAGNVFVTDIETRVAPGLTFTTTAAIRQYTPEYVNWRYPSLSYPATVRTLTLAPSWIQTGPTWSVGHDSDVVLAGPDGLAWFSGTLLMSDSGRHTVRQIRTANLMFIAP